MAHTIRTTHTGSLPRPAVLLELLDSEDERFTTVARAAVAEIVERQLDVGIDLVNDGEQMKRSYTFYATDRLDGFGGPPSTNRAQHNLALFPEFAAQQRSPAVRPSRPRPPSPSCDAPITRRPGDDVSRDIEALLAAAASAGVGRERLFMTAASPGVIALFFENRYYPDQEAYLAAIADAMRPEYEAIAAAGITLQLDCPDLAMARSTSATLLSVEEFRSSMALAIEALNEATASIDPQLMRIHLCWGNIEAPHTLDVELAQIVDIVVTARPAGISIEAANPRHGHEWAVFEQFRLPDEKYLVPGVIDTTTNFVEHPELVAQRIENYARIVGPERVVAGTDCGFATHATGRVTPDVMWAKFGSLVEGARLASERFASV